MRHARDTLTIGRSSGCFSACAAGIIGRLGKEGLASVVRSGVRSVACTLMVVLALAGTTVAPVLAQGSTSAVDATSNAATVGDPCAAEVPPPPPVYPGPAEPDPGRPGSEVPPPPPAYPPGLRPPSPTPTPRCPRRRRSTPARYEPGTDPGSEVPPPPPAYPPDYPTDRHRPRQRGAPAAAGLPATDRHRPRHRPRQRGAPAAAGLPAPTRPPAPTPAARCPRRRRPTRRPRHRPRHPDPGSEVPPPPPAYPPGPDPGTDPGSEVPPPPPAYPPDYDPGTDPGTEGAPAAAGLPARLRPRHRPRHEPTPAAEVPPPPPAYPPDYDPGTDPGSEVPPPPPAYPGDSDPARPRQRGAPAAAGLPARLPAERRPRHRGAPAAAGLPRPGRARPRQRGAPAAAGLPAGPAEPDPDTEVPCVYQFSATLTAKQTVHDATLLNVKYDPPNKYCKNGLLSYSTDQVITVTTDPVMVDVVKLGAPPEGWGDQTVFLVPQGGSVEDVVYFPPEEYLSDSIPQLQLTGTASVERRSDRPAIGELPDALPFPVACTGGEVSGGNNAPPLDCGTREVPVTMGLIATAPGQGTGLGDRRRSAGRGVSSRTARRTRTRRRASSWATTMSRSPVTRDGRGHPRGRTAPRRSRSRRISLSGGADSVYRDAGQPDRDQPRVDADAVPRRRRGPCLLIAAPRPRDGSVLLAGSVGVTGGGHVDGASVHHEVVEGGDHGTDVAGHQQGRLVVRADRDIEGAGHDLAVHAHHDVVTAFGRHHGALDGDDGR